ncbi:MAG: 4a-hydroxytetrahydrobiopterin dehydratase [Patescibacteria group bacterium]
MTSPLHEKRCVACEGGVKPLEGVDLTPLLSEIGPGWVLLEGKKIKKEYVLKSFSEAVTFVYEVAKIAEDEGHHPDIKISYNKVTLELWTHAIGGLSQNDFIVAAKINKLPYGI